MGCPLEDLANQELLVATHALIRQGRSLEVELLVHLGEIDSRRLYLEEACPSMFAYCVQHLHFSEAAAYKRIRAARATRSHPELLDALRCGELHVTAVSLLAAQLTKESCGPLIRAAKHKTADEIKRLLADRQPKPDVADRVRRVPSPRPTGNAVVATVDRAGESRPKQEIGIGPGVRAPRGGAPERKARSTSTPLGGERYHVSFTASDELHAQLQELRALMRHQIPDGDLASILGQAVALLLDQVRKQKFAAVSKPKPASRSNRAPSRQIPAAIRRAVAHRDRERCSYISSNGLRCGTQEFLEFHHLEPWARTGTHSIDGIALRCRAHNQYAAVRDFGEEHMARFRGQTR
ncbi:MAG: hypothetical protein GY937_29135 [bacterium]|nr:hypothetical protein [bacterium]